MMNIKQGIMNDEGECGSGARRVLFPDKSGTPTFGNNGLDWNEVKVRFLMYE